MMYEYALRDSNEMVTISRSMFNARLLRIMIMVNANVTIFLKKERERNFVDHRYIIIRYKKTLLAQ